MIQAPADRLFLALDVPTVEDAIQLCRRLKPLGLTHVKVGMSLFYQGGLPLLSKLTDEGLSIFLDLKLHDIPSTVARTTDRLVRAGVSFLNVHALGGADMMKAALEAGEAAASATGQMPPTMIAVTVLTNHTDKALSRELGINQGTKDAALNLAKLAFDTGMNGVVCSPLEASSIKENCGPAFLRVTPGIRPAAHMEKDDQSRVASPAIALQSGATHLVIGRPVYEAADPEAAFSDLLKEMGTELSLHDDVQAASTLG